MALGENNMSEDTFQNDDCESEEEEEEDEEDDNIEDEEEEQVHGAKRHRTTKADFASWAAERMLHCTMDSTTKKLVACTNTAKNRYVDTIMYRVQRMFGFVCENNDSHGSKKLENLLQANREKGAGLPKSLHTLMQRVSIWERFVLSNYSDTPYAKWLEDCLTATNQATSSLSSSSAKPKPIKFEEPPGALLVAYITHSRQDRELSGRTIKGYVNAIKVMCAQFGFSMKANKGASDLYTQYIEDDEEMSSLPFDFGKDLPNLYHACWYMDKGDDDHKLQFWAMFLISIVMMARASEMTDYCPIYEDIVLPEGLACWDPDGYPKYLYISLRNWKKRTAKNKNKPYQFRVHRNYVDARFDPVYWLMFWLSKSGIRKGPIFQQIVVSNKKNNKKNKNKKNKKKKQSIVVNGNRVPNSTWTTRCTNIFEKAGLYTRTPPKEFTDNEGIKHMKCVKGSGCTTHSIRISACQWAGRCEPLRSMDARNNGRWKDIQQMLKYFNQGALGIADGDPNDEAIRRVWVWKPVTKPGLDGRGQM